MAFVQGLYENTIFKHVILGGGGFLPFFLRQKVKNTLTTKITRNLSSIMKPFIWILVVFCFLLMCITCLWTLRRILSW